MLGNILEISKRASKGGRVPIKIALLKIHEDSTETNINGIHWKEEYVLNAIESTKCMPICASFCDENKSVPLDHGLTGEYIDENGMREPLFENSESVGVVESASIETVTIGGATIKALVCEGYLFNQRYPNLVQWVRTNYALSKVATSIEIMGTEINNNKIIYEEANPTEDFRTPKDFLFTSTCILSVSPADNDAIVLEVAQKKEKQEKKEEQETMEFNMDEIKSVIQSTIVELNNKESESNTKIAELNQTITDKETIISEQNEKISELNASVEQLQAALKKLKEDHETYWEEREILEKELAKAKVAEKLNELDATLDEFSEAEKEVAKEEIDNLTASINSCEKREELNNVTSEINSIKSKICMDIVAKQKKATVAEQNSAKSQKDTEVIDIFSEMCSETQKDDEDINIF